MFNIKKKKVIKYNNTFNIFVFVKKKGSNIHKWSQLVKKFV